MENHLHQNIPIPMQKIEEFCKRWKIIEFAFFGSVLRDDFKPKSDLDILVTFADDAEWTLFDHMEMELELRKMLKKRIDLFNRKVVEENHNWLRKNEILKTARVVYVAR